MVSYSVYVDRIMIASTNCILLFSLIYNCIISIWILNHGDIYTTIYNDINNIYENQNKSKKVRTDRYESYPEQLKNLTNIYETYNGTQYFNHWMEYAVKYEHHLGPILREMAPDKKFRMLEIGVQSGGSLNVWKSYFSSRSLYYVGMDIDEKCKRSEDKKHNIFIEIGSQMNSTALHEICGKHGPFNFIVDDGGHTFEMMQASLQTLFISDRCMEENSLYVVEDMHTMARERYSSGPTDIPSIPAELFRKMHYYWKGKGRTWNIDHSKDKVWADSIRSITLYDSMMFLRHKRGHKLLTNIHFGTDSFRSSAFKQQPDEYTKKRNVTIEWGWKQW